MTPAHQQALDTWLAARRAYRAAGGISNPDPDAYAHLSDAMERALCAFIRAGGTLAAMNESIRKEAVQDVR